MLRASLLVAATFTLLPLSVIVSCNELEVKPTPDAGTKVCDPGPFVFDPENTDGEAVPLLSKPSQPACSADGTNIETINRLPRGGWYLVGWKVQVQGIQTQGVQAECDAIIICNCVAGKGTNPNPNPTPITDAGADADASTTPAPNPEPTPGEPFWECFDFTVQGRDG